MKGLFISAWYIFIQIFKKIFLLDKYLNIIWFLKCLRWWRAKWAIAAKRPRRASISQRRTFEPVTGSSAPKMRATVHRTSVSHVAVAFTCEKISWPMPDDEVDRKFVVVVVIDVSQRVTSTSSKWRERPPTFPFRVSLGISM